MPGFLTSKSRMPGVPATAGMGDVRVHADHAEQHPVSSGDRSSGSDGHSRMFGPTKDQSINTLGGLGSGINIVTAAEIPSITDIYDTRHPVTGKFVKSSRSIEEQLHTTREND